MPTARENLDNIKGDMELARTVIQAVHVFVDRVPALVQAARDEALANGATADEVQPVSDLGDMLEQEVNDLMAKITTVNGQPAPLGNINQV